MNDIKINNPLLIGTTRTNPKGISHVSFKYALFSPPIIMITPKNREIIVVITAINNTGFSVKSSKGNQEYVWSEARISHD